MPRLKGAVSVFLALTSILTASLILCTVEAARTQCTKTYLETAAGSAMNSLHSQYHRKLWDDYRLLGLEMYSKKEIESEYYDFLLPYFSDAYQRSWYMTEVSPESIVINNSTLITDDCAAVFEKEVLDYMKLGIAAAVLSEGEITDYKDLILDGEGLYDASDTYGECALYLGELEDIRLSMLHEAKKTEELRSELRSAAEKRSVSGVKSAADGIKRSCRKLVSLSEDYADKLSCLENSEKESETKLENSDLSAKSRTALKEMMADTGSYKGQEGLMSRVRETASQNITACDRAAELAEEAHERIVSFEPETVIVGYGPPAAEGGEPVPIYEETEIDKEAVWAPAVSACSRIKKIELPFKEREPDEKKKNALLSVKEVLEGDLLKIVLPKGRAVSDKSLLMTDSPSGGISADEKSSLNIAGKLYTCEYFLEFTQDFTEKESFFETEYLIYGKDSDRGNIAALSEELLSLRTGLDFLYLSGNSSKRNEAGALAEAIAGISGMAPLVLAFTFLILYVWAKGQAVLDVRDLMAGEKVPYMHTDSSFYLSLEGLMGGIGKVMNEERKNADGSLLKDYERILSFIHYGPLLCFRCMDVIQENIRKSQPDFLMERLYTSQDIRVNASSYHLFSMITGTGGTGKYPVSADVHYSY